MLDTLKETGKNIGQELGRAWEAVSDGWRELFNRSGNALTQFVHGKDIAPASESLFPPPYPRWSLLAGEVEETDSEIIVRLEIPGLEREDCQVKIEGNTLFLSGKKRFERMSGESAFHVLERAYGEFERTIPLPKSVLEDQAEASYRNGVLTVRLPKSQPQKSRSIPVS